MIISKINESLYYKVILKSLNHLLPKDQDDLFLIWTFYRSRFFLYMLKLFYAEPKLH